MSTELYALIEHKLWYARGYTCIFGVSLFQSILLNQQYAAIIAIWMNSACMCFAIAGAVIYWISWSKLLRLYHMRSDLDRLIEVFT